MGVSTTAPLHLPPLEEQVSTVERPWESAPILKERASGKKIISFFPVYAPVEIIHACGALPLPLFGGGNQVEIVRADSRFASFVCSIPKSMMELAFQKQLNNVDGVVFSNICDVARNLASLFKRNFPAYFVEYLHLPQNEYPALSMSEEARRKGGASPSLSVCSSAGRKGGASCQPADHALSASSQSGRMSEASGDIVVKAAVDYYSNEIRRFISNLSAFTGKHPSGDDIKESIRIYNDVRLAVGKLSELRTTSPEKFSTYELAIAVRYAYCLEPRRAIEFLSELNNEAGKRKQIQRDRIRTMLMGAFCEQPPLELIRAIEEAGCWILHDDLAVGLKWFSDPIDIDGDAIQSLAKAYIMNRQYSSVKHALPAHKAGALISKAREVKAEGVIFCIPKFCEPALFDYPVYKKALEKAKIPHLQVEYEEKMWVFDRIRTEVETFVESILFW